MLTSTVKKQLDAQGFNAKPKLVKKKEKKEKGPKKTSFQLELENEIDGLLHKRNITQNLSGNVGDFEM
jgi:hypothetical protein